MALKLLRSSWSDEELSAARATIDNRFGAAFLSELHGEIIATQVCATEELNAILGIKASDLEFVLRQVCYLRFVAHERLNRPILIGASRYRAVVAGIPPKWRRVLVDRGIRVARFRSMLLWGWRATKWGVLGGALFAFHVLRMALPSERRRALGTDGNYAYLHTVGLENLPVGLQDLPATDIVSWLEQRTEFLEGIDTVASAIKAPVSKTREGRRLMHHRHPLAAPSGVRAPGRFVVMSSAVLLRMASRLIVGRWQYAILASMLVDAALLTATGGRGQAKIHLFNSSGADSTPLWTLIAPSFDIEVACYHYSANIENIRPLTPSDRIAEAFRLLWWDKQVVWDEQHMFSLSEIAERKSRYLVCGPVSFVATTQRLSTSIASKRLIAVFDVTPMNDRGRALWTGDPSYYTFDVVREFIQGLAEVASRHSLTLAWKSKRAIHDAHDPQYKLFQDKIGNCRHVHIMSPKHSAEQLIRASLATVSIPFTSTALIAHTEGKPSAFFDPTGSVSPENRALRGLPLLRSTDEFSDWLERIGQVNGFDVKSR